MIGFIWFWLVAVMIVGYVVLDGFDLGVGVLHLFLVRTEAERQATLRSIGPVWDGNEVWLLAGGGTLYFAFPLLYASAFSGFYLPLMIVLWLLVLRGVSLELRNHIDVGVWLALLDGVFGLSSALLTIFFGAALANVSRVFAGGLRNPIRVEPGAQSALASLCRVGTDAADRLGSAIDRHAGEDPRYARGSILGQRTRAVEKSGRSRACTKGESRR